MTMLEYSSPPIWLNAHVQDPRITVGAVMNEPTVAQLRSLYRLCCLLTANNQPIHLVRVDERLQMDGALYVLAGQQEGIERIIERNGQIRRV